MRTRLFEQEWTQITSKINHRIENNVMFDFYDYLKNMRFDLKALKKDYEQEFNKLSKKSLKHYIDLFEKRLDQYFSVLMKDYKKNGSIGGIQTYEGYNDGIILQNGDHHKIADKYYPVLKKLAESIFDIEDQIAPIVEKFWQQKTTSAKNYDPNGHYFMLAHVDRKHKGEEHFSQEFNNYNKSLKGLCFSLVTDKKTRLYNNQYYSYNYYSHPAGEVGIIAKPKSDSIVGISDNDMLSTEYVNGKCGLDMYFEHSKVDRCLINGNNEICCNGTKICPPKKIFNFDVDTINEIILDSDKIDVEAVFYVKNSQGKMPERLKAYKLEQEKRCGHKLPVIELKPHNYLRQINLDEVYGY